jgi:hypothetical protein
LCKQQKGRWRDLSTSQSKGYLSEFLKAVLKHRWRDRKGNTPNTELSVGGSTTAQAKVAIRQMKISQSENHLSASH